LTNKQKKKKKNKKKKKKKKKTGMQTLKSDNASLWGAKQETVVLRNRGAKHAQNTKTTTKQQ
jgi:hypothetical protein